MHSTNDVLFERRGHAGIATLNRPRALNALSLDMVLALSRQLTLWAADDRVARVILTGAGDRAFCAGGDIRELYDAAKAGDEARLDRFYRHEYRLNRAIARFPKPFIAVIDGITMGGGVGVSVHGSHRVASARTQFAMPETGIGFFPDVGGSYFLPRCPGEVGMYLGLTGARLAAADALYAGIATDYVPAARLDAAIAALSDAAPGADAHATVDRVLADFRGDPGEAALAARRALIDRCFAGEDVAAMVAALRAEDDPWAAEQAAILTTKSPLALAVTCRALRRGAGLTIEAALTQELDLAIRVALLPDFAEGVRAQIVDKDRKPVWRPATLEAVRPDDVAAAFVARPGRALDFDGVAA